MHKLLTFQFTPSVKNTTKLSVLFTYMSQLCYNLCFFVNNILQYAVVSSYLNKMILRPSLSGTSHVTITERGDICCTSGLVGGTMRSATQKFTNSRPITMTFHTFSFFLSINATLHMPQENFGKAIVVRAMHRISGMHSILAYDGYSRKMFVFHTHGSYTWIRVKFQDF